MHRIGFSFALPAPVRRIIAAAMVAILGVALTVYLWNPFHRVYRATALVMIQMTQTEFNPVPGFFTRQSDLITNKSDCLSIDSRRIESPDVLWPVIQALKLDQIWAKELRLGEEALPPEKALEQMKTLLDFTLIKQDYGDAHDVVAVTARGESPEQAADIANGVVDRCKLIGDEKDEENYNRGLDSLREMIAQQQMIVDKEKAEVEELKEKAVIPAANVSFTIQSHLSPAQEDLYKQASLLEAFKAHLGEITTDHKLCESSVIIQARAIPPPIWSFTLERFHHLE